MVQNWRSLWSSLFSNDMRFDTKRMQRAMESTTEERQPVKRVTMTAERLEWALEQAWAEGYMWGICAGFAAVAIPIMGAALFFTKPK